MTEADILWLNLYTIDMWKSDARALNLYIGTISIDLYQLNGSDFVVNCEFSYVIFDIKIVKINYVMCAGIHSINRYMSTPI